MKTGAPYWLVIPLLLAGCGRKPSRPSAASQPAGNPEQGRSPFVDPLSREIVHLLVAVTIPRRTRIRVRLAEDLDTRSSRPGKRFVAYLDEPIVSGERVVIGEGTTFEGHVIKTRGSGLLKG